MMASENSDRLRILTFTTLYPNAVRPQYSVFVENRLRHLAASGEISARVLAPVPYFPFQSERFGSYAAYARVPRQECRFGIEIAHPRYLAIPKLGMTAAPYLLYACARRALGRMLRDGLHFDLIDAHYFYPDGVAAVMLGRAFDLPVTVTARGTDINLVPNFTLPRQMILRTAEQADGVIVVSRALAQRLADLGVAKERTTVLRNGVDPDAFRPVSPYGGAGDVTRPLALSVGNLVPLKGHDLVLRAVAEISGLHLWIVGGGPERNNLEALAGSLGIAQRVRFLGMVPHERMAEVYSAADVLVLASEREGWPNVLLEAMACGTRVVTTKVSDVVDLVNGPAAGAWVPERSVGGLAKALRTVLAAPITREQTRAHALKYTWEPTTQGQLKLFRDILQRRGADGR
jgi:teichuronic acid biosynthesis glycosyltransferase TuaC